HLRGQGTQPSGRPLSGTTPGARLIEIRRLAQIGVFLLGLSQLPAVILSIIALSAYADPGHDFDWVHFLISAGEAAFVLSLVFASRWWAAVLGSSGTTFTLADLRRDELLRAAVPLLGLYLLLSGVADVLGAILQWFGIRGSIGFENTPL